MCLKLSLNPKVMYPNCSHIPSITDEEADTFSRLARITQTFIAVVKLFHEKKHLHLVST